MWRYIFKISGVSNFLSQLWCVIFNVTVPFAFQQERGWEVILQLWDSAALSWQSQATLGESCVQVSFQASVSLLAVPPCLLDLILCHNMGGGMVWLTVTADFVDLASKNSFKKEQAFEDLETRRWYEVRKPWLTLSQPSQGSCSTWSWDMARIIREWQSCRKLFRVNTINTH